MSRTWRVAVREYLENTKTKGFWIGIILFPVMILVFSQVPQFLEDKAVPTRHYTLLDRSGEFEELVRERIESRNRRRVLEELMKYAQKHGPSAEAVEAMSALPGAEAVDQKEAFRALGMDPSKFSIEPGKPLSPMTIKALVDQLPDIVFQNGAQFELAKNLILKNLSEEAPEFVPPRPRFRQVPLPEGITPEMSNAEIEEAMRPYLVGDRLLEVGDQRPELFALIIIPEDIEEKRSGIRYWSKTLTDNAIESSTTAAIAEEVRRREYTERKVDLLDVEAVQAIRVFADTLDPKKAVGEEEVGLVDKLRQWVPVGFVYLLWIAIFSTAQMLLNNMIEEKSNKVVEVLLSSVTPGELMSGKLLGIALLGLTMIGAWLLSLYVILTWKASTEAELILGLLEVTITPQMLVPFIIYFILGYLLYAAIFASIGSICNTIKDAQNFMGPVMMILMVPLITMVFIPRDPNGTLATVLSWIPLYTPFVMMNRAAADPPAIDLYGTMALLVVTALVMLWASGRIFRVGMLRTGQPPRIIELIRWITRPA